MNQWIDWAKKIQAISQTGKAFSKDQFDLDRYDQLSHIANEIIAHLADAPMEQVENFFVPDKGYPTPKVDLRAGVFKNGEILLVKERSDDKWSLPGGWADVCESPAQGIIREVVEESGYLVNNVELVGVKDRSMHGYQPQYPDHLYKLFFHCRLVGGDARENKEISEIGFFQPDELPTLSKSRVLKEDIEMLFEYHQGKNSGIYLD